MKKIIALLLAMAMLLSLAACGSGSKEQDPNLGKYMGVKGEMEGFSMSMEELFPGETYLELKSGGKVDLVLEGEKATGTWKLDGENFQMTMEGEQCIGTLKNGTIVFEYADSGLSLTFQKEGGSISDKLNPQETAAVTFNDAGYWELVRMESDNPEDCVTEEQMQTLKELGMIMYLNLLPDGTGVMFMDEEMPLTWQDGTVTFTEDSMSISYTLASGELSMNLFDTVLVFRRGEQPAASAGPLGLYQGTTYQYNGQTFQMTEIYNDLCTIELLEDGKAIFILGGEEMQCTWELDGEDFILDNQAVESPGTLTDGVITIDFMNMGMILTFVQDGGSAVIPGGNEGADDSQAYVSTFPESFIELHSGDWHGMAVVYEGTGIFEDDQDEEMEIIARLAFREDGTCEPYLACAFGGKDNNFKSLTAAYDEITDIMLLSGEFVNEALTGQSNLFVLDEILYVDVFVDDGEGNYMNLYAVLRPLDAEWDYENDWPCLPEAAVEFYKGKDFLEIAELFKVDVNEIPELDGQSGGTEETVTEPVASGVGILDFDTIAEVYDWILFYSSKDNGYQKAPYEEVVKRMGGVEGAPANEDLWNEKTRYYKWGISEDEFIKLTFQLKDGVWVHCGSTPTTAFMEIYNKYYG